MDVYMHRALLWAYALHEGEPDGVVSAFSKMDFESDVRDPNYLKTF